MVVFKLSATQIKIRSLKAKGLCAVCAVCFLDEKSSHRCKACLESDKLRTRERDRSVFGKWSVTVVKRTSDVLVGKLNSSSVLTWTHGDAVKKFGQSVKFYTKEGFVADHKIPRACVMHLNGTVDYEFASYVTALDNIQIITKSANVAKEHQVEKEIKQTVNTLRRAGITGRALYFRILNEFEHRLDYTNF
jgi:hypothetical protein